MSEKVEKRIERLRDALDSTGRDLSPTEWKELLEVIEADIQGHLEAIKEEAAEEAAGDEK